MESRSASELINEAVDIIKSAVGARRFYMEAPQFNDEELRDDWRSTEQDASGALAVAQRLATLFPGSPEQVEFAPDHDGCLDGALLATIRVAALIKIQDDVREIERSTGPSLSLDAMHEWVAGPAATFWVDGHYRAAVHAAASQVDFHLQAKLGRDDLSGTPLVREAFSDKPPKAGKPRLRFKQFADGSQRYTSIHEGSGQFGAGLMLAFRNTSAHDPLRPLSPGVAIEQLAAFSLLARIIDNAELDEA